MRRRTQTLRGRVVRSTALVSAVAMAAMVVTVVLVLSAVARNNVQTRLDDQLAAVTATLASSEDGSLVERETPDDSIDDTTWVFDHDGHQVEGPLVGPTRQRVARSLAAVDHKTTLERADHAYLAAPVRTEGIRPATGVVVISASLKPYESTRLAVVIGLSVVGILVTVGAAGIAAWTLRRALEPVESMAARAEDWSEHDLESRFVIGTADDEISQLGRTLNVLLDRVAGALRSEQRLTAELAHELRTPLTAIRGEAELGLMTPVAPEARERLTRVVALADRMTTVISTLVALARGHAESGARSSVREVVALLVEDRPTPPGIHLDVGEVPDVDIGAPPEIATRAVAPLVDNAVRCARTTVTISASVQGRFVHILVSDDGPGIDDAVVDALFADGARSTEGAGTGLGLALSRRVARTLGGDLEIISAGEPTTLAARLPRF